MKYFYIVLLVAVMGLCALCWHYRAQLNSINDSQTSNTASHTVTRDIITRIIEKDVPAKIDTVIVFVDSEKTTYETARLDTTLTKDDSSVDLSILYDEYFNTFSINSMFKTRRDSVYVFKETNTVMEKKPKFIGLTSGLRIDFQDEVKDIGIDVGAKFVGKYSISLGFDTRKTASVRFGVDF